MSPVLDVYKRQHPHIHVVALGHSLGGGVRTDVEADDDGVGGAGQHDVALVDGAHAAVDDPDADFLDVYKRQV